MRSKPDPAAPPQPAPRRDQHERHAQQRNAEHASFVDEAHAALSQHHATQVMRGVLPPADPGKVKA